MTSSPPAEGDGWFINMFQPTGLVASVPQRSGVELAWVDSGSGVVACPIDCAPEAPLAVPRPYHIPNWVSATNNPIKHSWTKTTAYLLDNREA